MVLTLKVAASKGDSSPARAESRLDDTEQTMSTTSTWHDEIDSLEYIGTSRATYSSHTYCVVAGLASEKTIEIAEQRRESRGRSENSVPSNV